MACKTLEIRILEYVEGTLPPAERAAVESHLAQCAPCLAFARQLREIDAALTAEIKAPRLSGEFNERLRQRIQAEAPPLSDRERQERRRALQVEFEASRSVLRKWALGIPRWPGLLACGAIGAGVGGILLASDPSGSSARDMSRESVCCG